MIGVDYTACAPCMIAGRTPVATDAEPYPRPRKAVTLLNGTAMCENCIMQQNVRGSALPTRYANREERAEAFHMGHAEAIAEVIRDRDGVASSGAERFADRGGPA